MTDRGQLCLDLQEASTLERILVVLALRHVEELRQILQAVERGEEGGMAALERLCGYPRYAPGTWSVWLTPLFEAERKRQAALRALDQLDGTVPSEE